MADNQLYSDGRYVKLPVGKGVESGDAVLVGAITGVATSDANDNDEAVVDRGGSYKVPVLADDGESAAVNIGDAIYHSGSGLDKDDSGVLFGYALEEIASGDTNDIEVLLK